MEPTPRPLSPHLGIYRWQVQMVTSILHRATGIALVFGSLVVLAGLFALAMGETSYTAFQHFAASPLGLILLLGWTWALAFHACNGLRHLFQDAGLGYATAVFVRNGWLVIIASLVLTILIWAWVIFGGAL
ncbi:MAG TPA: succinate dehydrogenase, cytochrome b556 subunit [Mizugakiibacter sp.]|nr:succinate dehydrogenase, cytochrome b556 subunit [Mizugakiibacter sp.]